MSHSKKIVLVNFFGLFIVFMSCENNNKEIDNSLNFDTVTDFEGNTYKTIEIGNQTWMAEDLKSTKYNDGSQIHLITSNSQWESNLDGAFSWYNNEPDDSTVYITGMSLIQTMVKTFVRMDGTSLLTESGQISLPILTD